MKLNNIENENYSKAAGKKTLILIVLLIVLIISLSLLSIFLILKKSSVMTQSTSYESPQQFPENSDDPMSQ